MHGQCEITGKRFELTPFEVSFLAARDLPIPRVCPEERRRLRLAFRSQRHLFRRPCAATGKSLISSFPPEFPGNVVALSYWWGDEWDGRNWGRPFDFGRTFFEQFRELLHSVPLPSSMVVKCENCDYNAYCGLSKNCYLCQSSVESENVCYTYGPTRCRDSLECHNIDDCELCYEVIHGTNCYDVQESKNVANCRESAFLLNCRSCQNCFFCTNLRNAQYCFKNEQLDRERYLAAIEPYQKLSLTDRDRARAWFAEFASSQPVPALWGAMNEDVSGNYIFHSKSVSEAFDILDSEDVVYGSRLRGAKTVLDTDFLYRGEDLYQYSSGTGPSRCRFSFSLYDSSYDIDYSASCASGSHDLFGCVGLRRAEYCILNQPYSREEYVELRAKVIAHMRETGEYGSFFPASLSPFAYNEAVAQDFYPLTREGAEKRGFRWQERPVEESHTKSQPPDFPADSREVGEDVLTQIYGCDSCGRPYKIQLIELQTARKLRAPLPATCFECRYQARLKRLEPYALFERQCSGCSARISTTVAPARPEPVLCEACYQQRVY